MNSFLLFVFLTQGLYVLSELRESYLDNKISEIYKMGNFNLIIRYVSYLFSGLTLYLSVLLARNKGLDKNFRKVLELMFHLFIIWVASSEVITWMDILHSRQNYKFGL